MITLLDDKGGYLSFANLIFFNISLAWQHPITQQHVKATKQWCVCILYLNEKAYIAQTYYKHEYIVT
jgi:hypothetical protein